MEGRYNFIGSYIRKEAATSVCLCVWLHLHRGMRRGFVSVSEARLIITLDSHLQALNAKCPSWLFWSMTCSVLPVAVNVGGKASFPLFFIIVPSSVSFHASLFTMQLANTQESSIRKIHREKQVIWLMLGVCFNLEECYFTAASPLWSVWAVDECCSASVKTGREAECRSISQEHTRDILFY